MGILASFLKSNPVCSNTDFTGFRRMHYETVMSVAFFVGGGAMEMFKHLLEYVNQLIKGKFTTLYYFPAGVDSIRFVLHMI